MADSKHKGYDVKAADMRPDGKTSNIVKGGADHGHVVVTDKGEVVFQRDPGQSTPTVDKKK